MQEIINYWLNKFQRIKSSRDFNERKIGVELKFQAVNSKGEVVKYGTVQKLWDYLESIGWEVIKDNYSKEVIGVGKEGNIIRSETGYPKIEFSLEPKSNLFELRAGIDEIKETIAKFINNEDIFLLGYGIQPETSPSDKLLLKSGRYLFLDEILSGTNSDYDLTFFAITASIHSHIEVKIDEMIDACNVFNGLAGSQIALTANSQLWDGGIDNNYKCVREAFWDEWIEEEGRVGIPLKRFKNIKEYINTIINFKPVYVIRDNEYFELSKFSKFSDYYKCKDGVVLKSANDKESKVYPRPSDFDLHSSLIWFNARISHYGTIENRANGQQPPDDVMTIPALTIGLVENLADAVELINSCSWDELHNLRFEAIRKGLSAKFAGKSIKDLCREMLIIAEGGLKIRGMGEEIFIEPLWKRLTENMCPADEVIKYYKENDINATIKKLCWAG